MPIKYDRFVKKPREEVEYSEEQIEELLACSLDIFEFIKYVKIVNPDKGEIPFKPYRYQKKLLKDLSNNRHICGLWSRQSGKCLCYSSMITIRNKKTNEIENISIGDFFQRIKK
jgi:hypothetical protein